MGTCARIPDEERSFAHIGMPDRDRAEGALDRIAIDIARAPEPSPLTERETEVVDLISQGWTVPDIATKLIMAQATVKHHTKIARRKLNVHTSAHLCSEALRQGLIK